MYSVQVVEANVQALTRRQAQILEVIRQTVARTGGMPSLRQIAQHFSIQHNAVVGHLKALERKGYLMRQSPQTSSFQLVDAKVLPHRVPLAATVPAGPPQMVYDQMDQYLDFSPSYFSGGPLMAVRVAGDSMAGDAIMDGDVAMIQVQPEAHARDIVAVRVGGDEVTLKRIRLRGDKVELIASNPAYPPRRVPAAEVEIIGKLVGIIRRV